MMGAKISAASANSSARPIRMSFHSTKSFTPAWEACAIHLQSAFEISSNGGNRQSDLFRRRRVGRGNRRFELGELQFVPETSVQLLSDTGSQVFIRYRIDLFFQREHPGAAAGI